MRGVGVHAQTLEIAFDHAVEQCCVPLDRLRLRFIRALGPVGLELVRNQELRVAVTGVLVAWTPTTEGTCCMRNALIWQLLQNELLAESFTAFPARNAIRSDDSAESKRS